jgi:MFS family permease
LNSYILASFGQTTFVFWFTQASSLSRLYLVAIGYGLFFGGVSMSALLTIRSFVPWRIAGTAIGLVSLFGWIGMGLGGYLGGVFFDWSGSYVASFALAAAAGVVSLSVHAPQACGPAAARPRAGASGVIARSGEPVADFTVAGPVFPVCGSDLYGASYGVFTVSETCFTVVGHGVLAIDLRCRMQLQSASIGQCPEQWETVFRPALRRAVGPAQGGNRRDLSGFDWRRGRVRRP